MNLEITKQNTYQRAS